MRLYIVLDFWKSSYPNKVTFGFTIFWIYAIWIGLDAKRQSGSTIQLQVHRLLDMAMSCLIESLLQRVSHKFCSGTLSYILQVPSVCWWYIHVLLACVPILKMAFSSLQTDFNTLQHTVSDLKLLFTPEPSKDPTLSINTIFKQKWS